MQRVVLKMLKFRADDADQLFLRLGRVAALVRRLSLTFRSCRVLYDNREK